MGGSLLSQADPARLTAIHAELAEWFHQHGRDLPWRRTRDPYAILVSEVMLQQTQVERVAPRWNAWMERFPTLAELANATRAEVIREWSGLGYNLRAARLHDIARQAVERYGGKLPETPAELLALKGVGRYTAHAVACFAFGQPVALVDTNVRRVLGRLVLGVPMLDSNRGAQLEGLAGQVLPPGDAWTWNQALMDLGATTCTAAQPTCSTCPLFQHCAAAPEMARWPAERKRVLAERRSTYGLVSSDSARQRLYRGRIVRSLSELAQGSSLELCALGQLVREDYREELYDWLLGTVQKLADDALLSLAEEDGVIRVRLP